MKELRTGSGGISRPQAANQHQGLKNGSMVLQLIKETGTTANLLSRVPVLIPPIADSLPSGRLASVASVVDEHRHKARLHLGFRLFLPVADQARRTDDLN